MPYKDKDKQREYQAEWCSKRRDDFFKDKECKRCGSKEKLELHHRDPSLKLSHRIWSWSWERIKAEADKCDILCSSCHDKHHAEERRRAMRHGTTGMYRFGCRCAECRGASARYKAEWRAKRINRV